MKEKILKLIKIVARVISVIILVVFLIFFIGEGTIKNLASLKVEDILLLLLIPGVLTVGTIIAWRKELLGGCILCADFIVFNIIDYTASRRIAFPNFLIIFVVGILFLIVGISDKKAKSEIDITNIND